MSNKDWTGDSTSVFKCLGSSHHADGDRASNDYYATPPQATALLLEKVKFAPDIWEPACGEGAISKVLEDAGYSVRNSDLVARQDWVEPLDFLQNTQKFNGDVITNPPYKYALEFVEKSLEAIPEGNKVAMLLKIQFLEGKARRELFKKNPPKMIYVFSSRINCPKNGQFTEVSQKTGKERNVTTGGAICFAWFIWEKGYDGLPQVDWIN